MKLALFDFDGTISHRDSFLLFLWHSDKLRFLFTCITHIPAILLYLCGRYPNQKLKELFLTKLFEKTDINSLEKSAEKFCDVTVPQTIRKAFWERLQFHQEGGHTVVVVTATPRVILLPWCRKNNIQIIGSELECSPFGVLSGKLKGSNCMGAEKVRRIQEEYDLATCEEIFAYGDTPGDFPMLDLARVENRSYKPFR
jgi:phosphatidylglycerophosphatase C